MSTPALEVVDLSRSFGGVKACDKVSFTLPDGSLVAVIGPNGAGKSTVFNLVTNLYAADEGEVRFYVTPIRGLSVAEIARMGLIRTFQSARIYPGMTTLENVLVGAHLHLSTPAWAQMLWLKRARSEERNLVERAETLLSLVGLAQFRNDAAVDLAMGAQKVLEIVRALMAEPRLLLLDEPAAGLNDAETADLADLLRAIRDSGVSVMVVEHNMSLVMGVADQVIVLDNGSIVARGTPSEIQRNDRVIAAYVGNEV